MTPPAGIEPDVPLSRFTTIGTGGPARWFGEPSAEDALIDMLRWARAAGEPFAIIGLGSNLIVRDVGVAGLVIRLGRGFNDTKIEPDNRVRSAPSSWAWG